MSKEVIAVCPKCGHNFITKKKQSGIKEMLAGAAIGSVVSIEFGPLAIGGAVAGGIIGLALGMKSECSCPKCGETFDRPEE